MSKLTKKVRVPIQSVPQTQTPNTTKFKQNLFRCTIEAQSASAGPPLGPLLGKYGLNIGNFCKDFNEKTKLIKAGIPLPITVRIKPDRSYTIGIHTPSIEYYLFQAAGVTTGKCEGDTTPSGKTTIKHIYEIAKIKHNDPYEKWQLLELNEVVDKIMNIARENGIEVTRDLDPNEYEEFLKERFKYLENLEAKIEEERLAKLQRT